MVLDYGAGRGQFVEDPVEFRRKLRDLRDRARVIGVDVGSFVFENPAIDEAHVLDDDGRIPLADGSVDVVVSDYTFEHLLDPAQACSEIARVLRPGGWVCVRTPNRHGTIALGARVVPNRFHVAALRVLQPMKAQRDTFPTVYRANTIAELQRLLPRSTFDVWGYAADFDPAYVGTSRALAIAFRLLARVTPDRYRSILLVFAQKRVDTSMAQALES